MLRVEEELSRHEGWMFRLALRLVRDEHRAKDLVQDAFLRMLTNPPIGRAPLRGWLWRTIYNLAVDDVRKERREKGKLRREVASERDDASLELTEARVVLGDELLRLPEEQRRIIHLRYVDGLGGAAISRKLGIPEVRVRRQTERGLDTLRERLKSRLGGSWIQALAPILWPVRRLRFGVAAAAGVAIVSVCALVATSAFAVTGGVFWPMFAGGSSSPVEPVRMAAAGVPQERLTAPLRTSERSEVTSQGIGPSAGAVRETGSNLGTSRGGSESMAMATERDDLVVVGGQLFLNGAPAEGWDAHIRPVHGAGAATDRTTLGLDGAWRLTTTSGEAQEVWIYKLDGSAVEFKLQVNPTREAAIDLGKQDLQVAALSIATDHPQCFLYLNDGTMQFMAGAENEGGQVSFPMAPLGTLSVLGPGEGFNPSTWPVLGYVTNTEDSSEVVRMYE